MKVQIHMTSHGRGEVKIDGKILPGVTSIVFRGAVGETNLIHVEFIADEVEVVSEETVVRKVAA